MKREEKRAKFEVIFKNEFKEVKETEREKIEEAFNDAVMSVISNNIQNREQEANSLLAKVRSDPTLTQIYEDLSKFMLKNEDLCESTYIENRTKPTHNDETRIKIFCCQFILSCIEADIEPEKIMFTEG